ncbi:HAMP domain-containing protein [Streptomyces sp. CG4]|uniref:HAMP domain-containing protein n=1 Tax=Streptomyces sp. CG4 TaxID=408783 RepID=UPI0034E2A018
MTLVVGVCDGCAPWTGAGRSSTAYVIGLAYAARATVTRQPVRATYLQDPDGRNGPVTWAASRSGGDILAIRRSYAPQARALKALDHELIGAGAAAVALGCGLGIVVAAAAGRRIGASARTTQQIAGGDLTARVEPRGKDEIARMRNAVNIMADALNARLEAERRVTADIAHELRTPVAGLVTAVGLLPPDRPNWSAEAGTICAGWSRTCWKWHGWTCRVSSKPSGSRCAWASWHTGR